MRRMTPSPHHRHDGTVGLRRAELGIWAVRTGTRMAVKPKRTSSGAAQAFHFDSRARPPLNLTGRRVRVQTRSTRIARIFMAASRVTATESSIWAGAAAQSSMGASTQPHTVCCQR